MDGYLTVKKDARAEFTEKKSRFIGHCRPVQSEGEALSFIGEIKARHREAAHNVYAYILRGNNIMRYSDDGEPGGTAGLPALDVLRKENLTDLALVVTRYFGGTLLGAGGLVRAYAKSAKDAVDAAIRLKMIPCGIYVLVCDYSLHQKLSRRLSDGGYIIKNTDFGSEVTLEVGVTARRRAEFEKTVAETSLGACLPRFSGTEYIAAEI